jgi:hypothetical protein
MSHPPPNQDARIEALGRPVRKSTQLGLSFPYDWSNPAISDEALILNVLKRGIYRDICRVCAHFGLGTVEALRAELPEDIASGPSMVRMLNNIKTGFARAEVACRYFDTLPRIVRRSFLSHQGRGIG